MEYRLKQQKLAENQEKYLPKTFLKVLERDDPGMILRQTGTIPEPLRRKPVLMLTGKNDKVVPWSACETFITKLGQENGHLKVIHYEGVGHEVNHPGMVADFKSWILQLLGENSSTALEPKSSAVKI